MRTDLSRRGVIAALAAGAAVNVPAIALTAAAMPADAPLAVHPDQALLDLGRDYEAALETEDAASDAWTTARAAAHAARPAVPDELRHRINDHFELQFPVLGETEKISGLLS